MSGKDALMHGCCKIESRNDDEQDLLTLALPPTPVHCYRLWFQLTTTLEQFLALPTSAPYQNDLFHHFILHFANKIEQLKLVTMGISVARQYQGKHSASAADLPALLLHGGEQASSPLVISFAFSRRWYLSSCLSQHSHRTGINARDAGALRACYHGDCPLQAAAG